MLAGPAGYRQTEAKERSRMDRRAALVGGGASGIGRAAATLLAAAGHRVVIMGRTASSLDQAAGQIAAETGGEVQPLVHDLADPTSADAALAKAQELAGPLSVLVLNAGGPPPGAVLDLDDAQWRAAFDLLLLGPLRIAALALPGMADRGFGRVVVITSTAVRQPQPGLAASTVLRAATTAAAKLLSREYADRGVTVNCVAPGATDTPRRRQVLAARAARASQEPAQAAAQDAADIPAGRAGTAQEVAAAVAFLASDGAAYINGAVLTVDGGRTETV
jgi:3-oxoacyl-[acyl-carrier protein] reductase